MGDVLNHDNSLCQLNVLDTVSDSASFGEVAATLLEACRGSDWNYSERLCDELVTELFKDNRLEDTFNEANCNQVRGLVFEHWKHQCSVLALVQRSQHRQNFSVIRGTEDTTTGK